MADVRCIAVISHKPAETIQHLKRIKDVVHYNTAQRIITVRDGTLYVVILHPDQMLGWHFSGYELGPNASRNPDFKRMLEVVETRIR